MTIVTRAQKVKPMGEGEFLRLVCHLLRLGGWRFTHSRPAIDRSGKWSTPIQGDRGFPDVFAVHADRGLTIAIELKTDKGKTTAEQDAWIEDLDRVGIRTGVWRPAEIDEITQFLLNRRLQTT
jgi:hypothetical protein